MGTDEVFYVTRMLGITVEEVMAMESGVFYWILEALIEQEMEEVHTCL